MAAFVLLHCTKNIRHLKVMATTGITAIVKNDWNNKIFSSLPVCINIHDPQYSGLG
jgi:hypothetical protein